MLFQNDAGRISPTKSIFDADDRPTISLPPTASSKGHQRSRTTVELPPLFTRSTSSSPTRSSIFLPYGRNSREPSPHRQDCSVSVNSVSPSTDTQRRVRQGTVSKITTWFEGASEPVNISFVPSPKKEQPDPFYQLEECGSEEQDILTSMDNLTQRPRRQNQSSNSTPNSSRFSFFKRSASPVRTDPDELIRLDIRESLFPDGPIEEVTPATFKNLQLNAESLLRRFQISYAENMMALKRITSEKNIQTDELDASNTRNDHLKMQLLEMAEKAADQERVIASLKSQLSIPQPSVRMIIDDEHFTLRSNNHRGRHSDVSSSDESFVDSETSSAVSVFSDAESVRTPATSVHASPRMRHASLCNPTVVYGNHTPAQSETAPVLVQQCQKCHNVPASEAWDVVEMMKIESACLKERIAELESAQDSALHLLTTLRL